MAEGKDKASESESLAAALPDPPTAEPHDPEQPLAKKQKVDAGDLDKDWEIISTREDDRSAEKLDTMTVDSMKDAESAGTEAIVENARTTGSAENMLSKDW